MIPKDARLEKHNSTKTYDWTYEGEIDFIGHLIGCISFIGGILVAFFGGIGMISMPYDLIYEYIYMP